MYDEIEYWNKRPYPNASRTKPNRSKKLHYLNYIEKHLIGCKHALDFGPGVGRTFVVYTDLDKLDCFDITNQHRNTLITLAENYNFKLNFTLGETIGVTPYKNKQFDSAIACQVLLHQRPININKVMTELLRVSNKVIVISWRQESKPDSATSGDYCFNHNYLKICKNNNWQPLDVNYDSKHIYFVYTEV